MTGIVLAGLDGDRAWRLADYRRREGYKALTQILSEKITPD